METILTLVRKRSCVRFEGRSLEMCCEGGWLFLNQRSVQIRPLNKTYIDWKAEVLTYFAEGCKVIGTNFVQF